jgi:hypothetical protein
MPMTPSFSAMILTTNTVPYSILPILQFMIVLDERITIACEVFPLTILLFLSVLIVATRIGFKKDFMGFVWYEKFTPGNKC